MIAKTEKCVGRGREARSVRSSMRLQPNLTKCIVAARSPSARTENGMDTANEAQFAPSARFHGSEAKFAATPRATNSYPRGLAYACGDGSAEEEASKEPVLSCNRRTGGANSSQVPRGVYVN